MVFPDCIKIKSGFGASGGNHFNHPRFQFCISIQVFLDDGRDLEAWKNNFKFAVVPNLRFIHFIEGTTYQKNAYFPLLKLSEEDEKAFTCRSLKVIYSDFWEKNHPVNYLACQIAKLNNLKFNDAHDPTEYLSKYFPDQN